MTTNIVPREAAARNGQPNAQRLIAWLTGLLTLALAVCAFILSFNALTDLAAKHGFSIPPLFPFVVEFAVIIFSLNALYRSLNGEPAKWQWVLVIGSSLLAGLFNIAHAAPDLLSRLMAAMPSLFLLLSFEGFLNLLKHVVNRQGIIQSVNDLTDQVDARSKELDTLTAKRDELSQQVEALKNEVKALNFGESLPQVDSLNDARQVKRQQRVDALRTYLLDNPQASLTEAAAQVGVSRQTAGEYVKDAGLHRNGNGWEVAR